MSDTLITALISVGGTLLVSIVTLFANVVIERLKSKLEMSQKELQSKREQINEVYKELISIINQYPNSSPNDILKCVNYPPNYSMESFDSILKSLEYQIDDYKCKLSNEPNTIEEEISNREYSIREIQRIRDEYFAAREKYNSFCKSDKMIFDLYAGQEVKDCLIIFENTIHNIFITGCAAGDSGDPINNRIQVSRRDLINCMRKDIGIK